MNEPYEQPQGTNLHTGEKVDSRMSQAEQLGGLINPYSSQRPDDVVRPTCLRCSALNIDYARKQMPNIDLTNKEALMEVIHYADGVWIIRNEMNDTTQYLENQSSFN